MMSIDEEIDEIKMNIMELEEKQFQHKISGWINAIWFLSIWLAVLTIYVIFFLK